MAELLRLVPDWSRHLIFVFKTMPPYGMHVVCSTIPAINKGRISYTVATFGLWQTTLYTFFIKSVLYVLRSSTVLCGTTVIYLMVLRG